MISIANLAERYDREFIVVQANTNALRDEVYRLRYQVFCIENSIFCVDDNPLDREKDEYDEISEHVLLYHNRSDTPIGTVRVVLPYLDRTEWRPLPMQRVLAYKDRQVFEKI